MEMAETEKMETKMVNAKKAYEGYCENTGWKSLATGADLPPFEQLKEEIKLAWVAAANAITAEDREAREDDISRLSREIFANAKAKGFYEEIDELLGPSSPLGEKQKKFVLVLWLSNRLMLIVSELAEGLEGLRHGNFGSDPKSGGMGEELADAGIRLFDLSEDLRQLLGAGAGVCGLREAMEKKMAYNATRERKHGGKAV